MTEIDTNTISQRNEMILEYYPLVRAIAYRMVRRIPVNLEVEEYINIGVLGLIDAVDRFDPGRGVPFKSYAEIRIRGAIMDALRAADWAPRAVRRKAQRIERTRDDLRMKLKKAPDRKEMSKALELTPSAFDNLCRDSEIYRVVSMNTPIGQESGTTIEDQVASDEESLEERWIQDEKRKEVVAAIRFLPKRERTVVTLSYLNGLTLKEIGQVLGVTESRACQVRSQALRRLKSKLSSAES